MELEYIPYTRQFIASRTGEKLPTTLCSFYIFHFSFLIRITNWHLSDIESLLNRIEGLTGPFFKINELHEIDDFVKWQMSVDAA
jgi:hypothetical protein